MPKSERIIRCNSSIGNNQLRCRCPVAPHFEKAWSNLGEAFRQTGKFDEAITCLLRALQLNPNDSEAENTLGNTIFQKGPTALALPHYERVVQLNPSTPEPHNMIGTLHLIKGDQRSALAEYQKAYFLNPKNVIYANNVAWILATSSDRSLRDGKKALELVKQAISEGGEKPAMLRTLAAAESAVGNYREAVMSANHAMKLATAEANAQLCEELRNEIRLYQAGKAVWE